MRAFGFGTSCGSARLAIRAALLMVPLCVAASGQQPSRAFIDGHAFDAAIAIEIVPMAEQAATRDALADALVEINELEALFDPQADYPRGIGALNAAAGKGTLELDDRAIEVLHKAQLFCIWSENAHGPLGGVLYASWGLRGAVGAAPTQQFLAQAIASAGCENLTLDRTARTAVLTQGSRVDLWGFARGYAVDRAVLRLRQAGAASGWVQIGDVVRAFVENDEMPGWQLQFDATDPNDALVDRLVLRNQAVAMVSNQESETNAKRLRIVGRDWVPYLDQRTGAPIADKAGVLVVTESGVDAFALAVALYVQNPREGEFRSGQLRPRPAVKWILGTPTAPLENSRGWADLPKWTSTTGLRRR